MNNDSFDPNRHPFSNFSPVPALCHACYHPSNPICWSTKNTPVGRMEVKIFKDILEPFRKKYFSLDGCSWKDIEIDFEKKDKRIFIFIDRYIF